MRGIWYSLVAAWCHTGGGGTLKGIPKAVMMLSNWSVAGEPYAGEVVLKSLRSAS
jgi:hypothetical protein